MASVKWLVSVAVCAVLSVAASGQVNFYPIEGAPINSTYYVFNVQAGNYFRKKKLCEKYRAEVATFESDEEMEAVASYISTAISDKIKYYYVNGHARWGSFTWGRGVVTDLNNSPMWCSESPNADSVKFDCVFLRTSGDRMCLVNDSCADNEGVICERNPYKSVNGCECGHDQQ